MTAAADSVVIVQTVMRFPFFLGHPLADAHEEQQDQEGEKRSEYDAD
jgi:hypothetical protein